MPTAKPCQLSTKVLCLVDSHRCGTMGIYIPISTCGRRFFSVRRLPGASGFGPLAVPRLNRSVLGELPFIYISVGGISILTGTFVHRAFDFVPYR